MALIAHVAPHPDVLVERLSALVSHPVGGVFDAEVVAVPTRGIERWLTQRIASELAVGGVGDGICANVEFPSPRRLVGQVLAAVPGTRSTAAVWEGQALTARVLAAIDERLDEPWMALLRRHLDSGIWASPGANRLAAAQKVATLFARYARRRPGMVRSWAAGTPVGSLGEPLADSHLWQFRLWGVVREAAGVPSYPEILPEALEPLATGEVPLELPARISVYGLTAIDPLDLDVVRAVAATRDVHLFLLHPSPALWRASAERLAGSTDGRRDDDAAAGSVRHPMLASWAMESRDLQAVLAQRGVSAHPDDDHRPVPDTVLGRLQEDIRQNRPPATVPSTRRGGDRSVQVHVCHGARRQVEVLRDALLHTLTDDPTLEPRDVVIMTPDLTTFAPLLEAAFPTGASALSTGMPDLRLRIADRSPAAVNPLVRFTAAVLDLADSRLEAGVIRELVTRPVVQQRFGFDGDGAGSIIRLIDEAGVKWGLDEEHRAEWGIGGVPEQTWRRGLDRALAGVFFADSPVRVVGGVAPIDGIEGQDATPAGHLAAIVDRVTAIRALFAQPMPRSQWSWAIATAVRMLAAPAWGDEWQWNQLERLLAETFPAPTDEAADPVVGCADAREAVAVWTDDRPSPLHFQSGDITVCTLVPMRSVPYRVVCLLGMDDQRFPRSGRFDGDDLLADGAMVGDTDRSSQDRQLLLDALLAAGDRLIVTYSGRDELTNAPLPPSVPISELQETIEVMTGDGGSVVTVHPLQSFNEINFTRGALGVGGPWAFDARNLSGARAVTRRGEEADAPAGGLVWPAEEPREVVALDDLIAFLQHPAKQFVRERLMISIPDQGEVPDDTLTTDLDALERWGVKNRILSGLVAGNSLEAMLEHERAADTAPPGELGVGLLEKAAAAAEALWNAASERGFRPQAHQRLAGSVMLGERRIDGAVDADHSIARRVSVTPSTLKAPRRLRAFIEMVFLTAVAPETAWTSLLVGRNDTGSGDIAVTFGPLGTEPAQRRAMAEWVLARYLKLFDRGHQAPLPMPCATGYAWQRKATAGDRDRAFQAGRKAWEFHDYDPESKDPAYALLFPHLATTEALVLAGFEHHCEQLWAPVLRFMEQERI